MYKGFLVEGQCVPDTVAHGGGAGLAGLATDSGGTGRDAPRRGGYALPGVPTRACVTFYPIPVPNFPENPNFPHSAA